jgi:plastocyanin
MGDYYYQPAEIAAQPGEIQLTITNAARRRHTLNIQDRATGADLVAADLGANQATTMTFTPSAEGSYRIYCNITDHAERGQVGTLIVARSARP